jgi:hypothetical protein
MSSDAAPRPRRWPPRHARSHPRGADPSAPPRPRTFLDPATERIGPGSASRTRRPAVAAQPALTAPSATASHARRADAGALAAAFGVDFLSWDEADPLRRGRALAPYALPPVREEQLVAAGWPGGGRQRGELALPGSVVALADGRLLVHVRVRVTPFRRLAGRRPADRPSHDVLPFPAAAPAAADPGWVGLGSYWYELLVPLRELAEQWRVEVGAVIAVPPLPSPGHTGVSP